MGLTKWSLSQAGWHGPSSKELSSQHALKVGGA